jgi:cathepsin D
MWVYAQPLSQLYARNTTRFSSNMFSFFFSDEDTGSELYLGGVNNAKLKKPISYFPVTRKAYWQIGNGAVRANGVKTDASALQVIVDTGTTLVYAVGSAQAAIA